MYSKQRYKIFICSVILEELESFSVFFQYHFTENFRSNLTYYESENSFFQSENFMVLFCNKKQPNLVSEM